MLHAVPSAITRVELTRVAIEPRVVPKTRVNAGVVPVVGRRKALDFNMVDISAGAVCSLQVYREAALLDAVEAGIMGGAVVDGVTQRR